MGFDSVFRAGVMLLVVLIPAAGSVAEQDSVDDTETPIAPVAVTASSAQARSLAPENLIDGSGLSETPPGSGTWTHHANAYRDRGVERGTMWASGDVGGRRDTTPTLTFDFGKTQRIGSVRVWNFNELNWTRNGAKEVEFFVSTDGETFTPLGKALVEEAPGDSYYEGQLISFRTQVEARYVRLHCLSNWGGERVGLAEVRFYTGGAGAQNAIAPGIEPVARVVEPNRPNPPRPAIPGAENIVFPYNAGIIDVTAAPYYAKGDGQSDDTAAIQKALYDYPAKGTIIYLPNGTYRITRPLRWGRDQRLTVLQGQSRTGTIIKLTDSCPGYGDPASPREMIWTGARPAQRFRNQIRNMTFDTGKGNPGAIAVRFIASNVGCMRDVDIRSGDGTGVIGLDLSFTDEIGPCFIKNVRIRGFDIGIATKYGVNGIVFENITLTEQNRVGWLNNGHPVTVRNLVSDNAVPVVRQEGWGGFFTLIEAKLTGRNTASSGPAIELHAGGMFARDVTVSGYASAVEYHHRGEVDHVPGPSVREWASAVLPGSGPASLRLPIKETPDVPWDDPKDWAVIADYGARMDGQTDDSEALQRAIDSGKTTVCLPRGRVALGKPVVIRGNVRRLIGCETFLKILPSMPRDANIFTVGESPEPVLVVERFTCWFWDNASGPNFIDNPTRRTLVLRELVDVDDTSHHNPNGRGTIISGPGELFVEDVTGRFHLKPGTKAWMRGVNPETNQDHRNTVPAGQWHLKNEGGQLWILGIKTEGPGTVITTWNNGRTELLGGLIYSSGGARTQDLPMFIIEDSLASFALTEANFSNNAYRLLILLKRAGKTAFELRRGEAPTSGGGSMIPLWATP
ncbi:MAG: glycosyl hydrolase family 28-related protein [Thermogutta sp.]